MLWERYSPLARARAAFQDAPDGDFPYLTEWDLDMFGEGRAV